MTIKEFSNVTTNSTPGETLDELNFRYAQTMLPFAVMLGMYCLLGILGNVLVLLVFFRSSEYKHSNFRTFVIFLAAVDLLSCMSLVPMEIDKTRNFFIYSNRVCKIKCFFHTFGNCVVILTFFLICIDQYKKVCRPLNPQILPNKAIKLSIVAALVSVLLSLMAPIMCGVSSHLKSNSNNVNITVYMCSAEKQWHFSTVRYIYKAGLTGTLALVSVAIVVMYILIMATIIKRNKQEMEIMTKKNNVLEMITMACKPTGNTVNYNTGTRQRDEITRASQNLADEIVMYNDEQQEDDSSTLTQERRNDSDGLRRSISTKRLPNMTLVWFTLTLIFLVTFIVYAGLSFLTTSEHQMSPTNLLLYQIFYRLYYINHIINPLIYAFLDKRFTDSCYNFANYVRRNHSVRQVVAI